MAMTASLARAPTPAGATLPDGAPLPGPSDFAAIFEQFAPFVWRTLRRLGVAEADVEDVSQDVFVTVHRKLATFEGRSSLRTWIYGIALRVASDHRRRAHVRRERSTSRPPERVASPTQPRDLDRRRARAALDRALDTLDDDKRAVMVLYEIEELPMADVASAVGCPLQTAYARLYAGRRLVKEALEREQSGGAA